MQRLPGASSPRQKYNVLQQYSAMQQKYIPRVSVSADPATGSNCVRFRCAAHNTRRNTLGLSDCLQHSNGNNIQKIQEKGAGTLFGSIDRNSQGSYRAEQWFGLGFALAGAADHSQAIGSFAVRRKRTLRRSLAGSLARRESCGQSIFHPRRSLVVPRD